MRKWAADYAPKGQTVAREMLGLAVGKRIGRGCYRAVYELPYTDKYVMKVEPESGSFMNILEWEVWKEVRDTKWARYFAPCANISANGTVLIMHRAEILKKFPVGLQLPSFFQDVKPDNFGDIDGQIVCVDYSISHLLRAKRFNGSKLVCVRKLSGIDR